MNKDWSLKEKYNPKRNIAREQTIIKQYSSEPTL